jgi:hypothetical protein
MSFVTRDAFLQNLDVPTEELDVKYVGSVRLRGMNVEELLEFIKLGENDKEDVKEIETIDRMAMLTRAGMIDDDGNNLYTREDDLRLKKKSLNTLRAISRKVMKLSGLLAETQEEILKNLPPPQSTDLDSL